MGTSFVECLSAAGAKAYHQKGVDEYIRKLESENAELKKYLKYARDDKKIRLGEIQELGEKIVEMGNAIDHLQGQVDRLRSTLTSKETSNENPQT